MYIIVMNWILLKFNHLYTSELLVNFKNIFFKLLTELKLLELRVKGFNSSVLCHTTKLLQLKSPVDPYKYYGLTELLLLLQEVILNVERLYLWDKEVKCCRNKNQSKQKISPNGNK